MFQIVSPVPQLLVVDILRIGTSQIGNQLTDRACGIIITSIHVDDVVSVVDILHSCAVICLCRQEPLNAVSRHVIKKSRS